MMHSCHLCGCACYCGVDVDDSDVGAECVSGCGCEEDDDSGPIECRCGRVATMEACQQCGAPLCSMCFETGAGFCEKHPDDEYRPPDGT